MQNGKIALSVDDAVALAQENNLDIGIAALQLNCCNPGCHQTRSGRTLFWACLPARCRTHRVVVLAV